jgi:hypothetical protein
MVRCSAVKKKGSTQQCTAKALFGHAFCGTHARSKSAQIWKDAEQKDLRVIKCQAVARGWRVRHHLFLAGPGVLCRKDLANEDDLVTCQESHRQHPFDYFAFLENGKIWWFNFDTIWMWSLKSLEPSNPYTRATLSKDTRVRLRELWVLRVRRGFPKPVEPTGTEELIAARWTMLCQVFTDHGFTDVPLQQLIRLSKSSHIAMWRFLRADAPVTMWQCIYMLSGKMLNSNTPTYIVNSLRLLMRVVMIQKEPYETIFNVMSAIYRC